MTEAIAFCGLECGSCPAYIATQSGDTVALAGVAARWSSETDMQIAADSILCDGCKSGSTRINTFCAFCGIRECAVRRGFDTCARCEAYPCEKLLDFQPFRSEGKANLDRLRGRRQAR